MAGSMHEMGTNLYIAGIPKTTDDATFRQLFAAFGSIQSTKLCQGKFPEKFGFVRYSSAEEAQTAINSMNNFEFGGKRLQVRLANEKGQGGNSSGSDEVGATFGSGPTNPQYVVTNTGVATLVNAPTDTSPSSNLYIKGLPPHVTDQMLQEVFGAYGSVKQTRVLDKAGLAGDSIVLVRMGTVEEATWIVNNLNGNIPQGLTTPVTVKFADPPEVRAVKAATQVVKGPPIGASGVVAPTSIGLGGLSGPIGSAMPALTGVGMARTTEPQVQNLGANVYIAGIPETTDEDTFRKLFEGFGTIVSAKLCQGKFPEKYGFVRFSSPEEGQMAINTMNNFKFGTRRLQVRVANEKSHSDGDDSMEGETDIQNNNARIALKNTVDTPTESLLITGLPQNVTEQTLQEVFGAYAAVIEVQVLAQSGAAGSVATVRLSSVDDAIWMMTNLNGNIPQGLDTPLNLRYHKAYAMKTMLDTTARCGAAADPMGIAESMIATAQHGAIKTTLPSNRYTPYGGSKSSAASPALMQAVSDTVSKLKGFPAPIDGMDPANLYIKSLPQDADDLYLYNIFSPFGALQSVHIMADDQGLCNGVGFVRFGFPQDAQIAVSTLNGNRLPDGNILYVSAADAAAVVEQVNGPLPLNNFTNNQDQTPGHMYGLVDGLMPLGDSNQIQGGNNTQISAEG